MLPKSYIKLKIAFNFDNRRIVLIISASYTSESDDSVKLRVRSTGSKSPKHFTKSVKY